jgi:hypothetical protein
MTVGRKIHPRLPRIMEVFMNRTGWYADLFAVRTPQTLSIPLSATMRQCPIPPIKLYRNPVIYARELQDKMIREHLSRRQLGDRHGISSDRITQILLVLDLPEDQLAEVIALGDYWETQVVTERELRGKRLFRVSSL